MVSFLKYYVSNLVKKWQALIVFVPKVISGAFEIFSISLPKHNEILIFLANLEALYQHYFLWILLLYFIIVNFWITFDLWKKNNLMEGESIPTGLNDDYEVIADFVREVTPANYNSFIVKLKRAYKFYIKQNSVKNIICTHFSVYHSIDVIIKDCHKQRTIPRSTNTTSLIDAFNKNYKEINRLNDEIGKNKSINPDTLSVYSLIQETNNNLQSLFPYYTKI